MISADVFGSGNPFPRTPVARLAGPASETPFGTTEQDSPITVDTATVADMRKQLDDYFARPPQGQRIRGRALALVGSLGVGKTHVAGYAAEFIRAEHPSALMWVIDEVVPDLTETYRRLVTRLRQDDSQRRMLEAVVRDYSADVAAVHMDQRNETDIAAGLRGRTLDPDKVIEKFRLDDELVYREMRRHLGAATESFREFANALALLPDRDFEDSVWNWLSGNPPLPSLTGRGITGTIEGTSKVLDTLAMFAFLYGNAGEPCVLVIDSLEKVLDWPPVQRSAFVEVFERLINVYVSLGGLLIFCIQPEQLNRLRSSLHDRITQIWPVGLRREETGRLVELHLAAHWQRHPGILGGGTPASPVWPFSLAAIREIHAISDGNPRRILGLSSEAWRHAESTRGLAPEIDQDVIHSAARVVYERVPRARVLEQIETTLQHTQWPTRSRGSRAGGRAAPAMDGVDFEVITGRDTTIGIAVFDSVFTYEDYQKIEATVTGVQFGARPGSRAVLVVVNGYLSRTNRDQISQQAMGQPIVYREPEFQAQLRQAIDKTAARLAASGQDALSGTLNERINALSQGQIQLLESVNRVGFRLDDFNKSVRRLAGSGTAVQGRREGVGLPAEVAEHFNRAFETLAAVSGEPGEFRARFGVDDNGMTSVDTRPHRLEFDQEQFTAIGIEVLAERMLRAFRDNLANWIGSVRGSGPNLTAEQRHSLFVICRSFEITVEMLPLVRLRDRAGVSLVRAAGYESSNVSDVLNRLARDVSESALAAVSSSN